MKRIFTLLFLLTTMSNAFGQATLWTESFDSSSAATYTVSLGVEGHGAVHPNYNNVSDYFIRTGTPTFLYTGAGLYNNTNGDFFAAQDVDGYQGSFPGGANPSQLIWTGIPISGHSGLTFSGLFASSNHKIDNEDSVLVEYSIDGAGWVSLLAFRNDGTGSNKDFMEDSNFDGVGDQFDLDSNFLSFSKTIPSVGNTMSLRITVAVDAGGEDVAFDEFKITGMMSTTYNPTINAFTPVDGSMDVPTHTDLMMTLDTAVIAGTGSIHLVNTTSSMTTDIAASSSDVSFSGKNVTVTNLSLDHMSDYTILVDSDAFVLSTGEVSNGIYDSTRWNFTTMEAADTLTDISTSFEDCGNSTGIDLFRSVDVTGGKFWRCSIYGHDDSSAAYMNAYSGGVQTNLDYLISPAIDFAGSNIYLSYWQKSRFNGDNEVSVLYSTDYDGVGSPDDFTWTSVYSNTGTVDTNWEQIKNLDLSAAAGSIFYVAFKYDADAASNSGVYEWTIDDITLSADSADAINSINFSKLNARVLGNPITEDVVNIELTLPQSKKLTARISNIMGQEVFSQAFKASAGTTTHDFKLSDLPQGIYILDLQSDSERAVFKLNIN